MNKSIDNQSFGLPIPLPLEFKKCGFWLKQEYRLAAAVVYSVTDIITGDQHGYEVFEVRIQQPKTLPNGVQVPLKEKYPSPDDFGKWAFAPSTIKRAVEIFMRIELEEVAKYIKLMDTPQQIAKNLVRAEFEPSF
jgi:hypothetical protein